MKQKLPNFLIVGAAKCGTSSLHNYLNQHPDIFMPTFNKEGRNVKEPQFLISERLKDRIHFGVWGWEEYKSLFNKVNSENAIGESSVFYLYYYNDAIKEIKNRLGKDIKIIIMLRNPIDRAYSAFQHVSRGLIEKNTFEEALILENGRLQNNKRITPMVMYKDMGMYYRMVKAYIEEFKDVHIILYEDFNLSSDKVVKDVFRFLGVDKNKVIDTDIRYNVGGKRWINTFLKNIFIKDSKLKLLFKQILSRKYREYGINLINKLFKKNIPMKIETRQYLAKYFKKDIIKLSEIIGKDLTNWIK
tara:strand:- start:656 stop:1561 length:906 start_codon:yes stop_codon:yes gene_type:complete